MNFFRRRPLVLAISLSMLVTAAAAFLPGALKAALMVLIIAAVPIWIILLRRHRVMRLGGLTTAGFVILCAVVSLCMLLTSYAYFSVYVEKYEQMQRKSADRVFDDRIRCVITDFKYSASYSATYVVRLESVNGEAARARGLMYTEDSIDLEVGDVIEVDVSFIKLSEFYEAYDMSDGQMLANGYVFTCEAVGSAEVVGERDSIEVMLTKLRRMLSAHIQLYLDRDAAALMDALLLADRSGLGRIRRDFNYIGATHLLALSGLHVTVLSGGLLQVLLYMGFGRRTRYVIASMFLIFYMALTGFPLSVVRAVLMMIIVYAAAFFDTQSDWVTSLFMACGLIILCSPSAVFDEGFLMSFAATLGVNLMGEDGGKLMPRLLGEGFRKRPWKRQLYNLLMSVLASLGAVMFVLPLQWMIFGEASTLSVLSTLILAPICEMLLVLLPPYLICSLIGWHFMCGRLGWLITVLSGFCEMASEWMSGFAKLVSLKYPFVPVIIIGCAAVIIWMMIRGCRTWLLTLIPFGASCAVFFCCTGIYHYVNMDRAALTYLNSDAHDVCVVVSRNDGMIVDITEGSRPMMFAAQNELSEQYITEVDTLMLTHIHRRHEGSVRRLMESRMVRRLLVPLPADEYERLLLLDIAEVAGEYGSEILFYSRAADSTVSFGDVEVEMPAYTLLKRSTHPLVAINFRRGDTHIAYAGTAAWENAYVWGFIDGAHTIIFGMNGPKYKTPPEDGVGEKTKIFITENSALITSLKGGQPALTWLPWSDSEGDILRILLEP